MVLLHWPTSTGTIVHTVPWGVRQYFPADPEYEPYRGKEARIMALLLDDINNGPVYLVRLADGLLVEADDSELRPNDPPRLVLPGGDSPMKVGP